MKEGEEIEIKRKSMEEAGRQEPDILEEIEIEDLAVDGIWVFTELAIDTRSDRLDGAYYTVSPHVRVQKEVSGLLFSIQRTPD